MNETKKRVIKMLSLLSVNRHFIAISVKCWEKNNFAKNERKKRKRILKF